MIYSLETPISIHAPAKGATKAVEKEEQENMEKQQAMFGLGSNTPPDTTPKDDVDE